MDTKDLEGVWEAHARHDPLWAILSDPAKKNRGWEVDRFFASGDREIRFLLRDLKAADIDVSRRDALDFGCGVGRLTQALSQHFERVVGVDISPTMIELAEAVNASAPSPQRIRFVRNPSDDLAVLSSNAFDFVYTNIVLQHIPPRLTKGYLRELVRVLRPGGVLVFQLPSHPRPDAELGVRAMPDEAYRAEVHVDAWPRVVTPSARVGLAVQVVNASPHAWHPHALGQVNLGNHWLAHDGTMERQDDARAGLPKTLNPGEHAEILIAVTTPDQEGRFACELDLVHETITWFRDRGSETCRLPIEVSADGARASAAIERATPALDSATRWVDAWNRARERVPAASSESEPEPFPMFGIPRDELLEFLSQNGVAVLSVDEDGHAGWDWVGYRYTVRKPR
jgi:SAM-dependent methyltransferase